MCDGIKYGSGCVYYRGKIIKCTRSKMQLSLRLAPKSNSAYYNNHIYYNYNNCVLLEFSPLMVVQCAPTIKCPTALKGAYVC